MAAALNLLPLGSTLAVLLALDCLLWLAFVPDAVTVRAFVWSNAAICCMFLVGLVSAANGLSLPIVTNLLYDAEHPEKRGRGPEL